jgi:GNAT superfamily N-acetyltransferase
MFRSESDLPRGYRFVYSGIDSSELYRLNGASEQYVNFDAYAEVYDECQELLDESMAIVGVRNRQQELIGVGVLNGTAEHAALSDLVVHPEHRHKGIGKALIQKRLALATELGVRTIGVNLVPSNSLGSLYFELGFEPREFSEHILEKKFV